MSGGEFTLTPSDLSLLERLETSLWETETRFDRALMTKTLAADFVEFGGSGRVWSREQCLDLAQESIAAQIPLENFAVKVIAPDVALITYVSAVATARGGERANRSSLWSRVDGRWQLRFHQGTPIPD
jgi:hypothetical protein